MPPMSELKPVMVRLPPELWRKLDSESREASIPPAVFARSLIARGLSSVPDPESEKPKSDVGSPRRPANRNPEGTRAERRAKKRKKGR